MYPLILLDFEASSLSRNGYPIEVGVAIACGRGRPLSIWSSLIRPERAWMWVDDWNPAAERKHGISATSLKDGCSAREVAEALNSIIGPVGHANCDGGYYDGMWLERLFRAAGIAPEFTLLDLTRLFVADQSLFKRFSTIHDESEAPHRAGADAARLCFALVRANA